MLQEHINEVREETTSPIGEWFNKIPNWLRWIITLPIAILGYCVVLFVFNFVWFLSTGSPLKGSYLGQSLETAIFVLVPLLIIYDGFPKHKVIITIIFASVYIIFGIYVILLNLIFVPFSFDFNYFFQYILLGLIDVSLAIWMIVITIKLKYHI